MPHRITKNTPDPRVVYADIIDLPHHQSDKHPHMSLYNRAAQFAAYKALSGYEDMIDEEFRLTDRRVELEETVWEILNRKFTLIRNVIANGESPVITFTYFLPDEKKAGGRYIKKTDGVKRIDTINQKVILKSRRSSGVNETIPINDIVDIQGELVDLIDFE